eukprot:CAMPEP_0185028212 /NCGR_PEP_ID=MMETSP1103-20130426/13844_1 /TAXON_ID=36769 /ORGANISM="Paraphysomonas bandaiensis, Strain Caron Lab Isolate" /LENGTH=449 /DNA_ID=CAMNT_0027562561 /DNA_START=1 /DNA_END=1350 /DNA_ORIENTATION=+
MSEFNQLDEPAVFIRVTITDPLKQSDSFGSYMIYKVNTTTNHSKFQFSEFSVLRRFSDFVWLHDQLNFSYPGAIVPPLPEKQAVGRFSTEFVECRRRALEKFMSRVTKHTTLKDAECLQAFLQADDVAFSQSKEEFRLEREKVSGTLASWFETKVNALTATNSQGGLEKNAADLKFEEILQYVSQLENQMESVSKHTSNLVKQNRALANALFEFGQAFTWLGQSEGDALGAALTQMGNTADQLSVLATENAESECVMLEEPLEEYVRMLASVKMAMKRRQEKKAMYVNAILDLESKQSSFSKVRGVPGKEDVANAKLALVEKSQSNVESARVEYEEVSERLLEEFDRFKREKAEDMKLILLNYVNLQIQFNRKAEKAWGDLIPYLKGISSENGLPFSTAFPSLSGENTTAVTGDDVCADDKCDETFANASNSNTAGSNFREEEEEFVGV